MTDWTNVYDKKPASPKQRRGGCGLIIGIIIAVATIGGIGIGLSAIFAPDLLNGLMAGLSGLPVKQSQPITGDVTHFNPIKSYAEAQTFAAKDAELTGMTASFVRPDGTMDLTATYSPAPNTEYKFVEPAPTPSNAPPVGAGGSATAKYYLPITITAYQPGKNEYISQSNGGTSLEYTFVNKGYSRETDDVNHDSVTILPTPQCDFAQMWKTALQRTAAKDNEVATITYSASGYAFEISGAGVSLNFGMDCAVKN